MLMAIAVILISAGSLTAYLLLGSKYHSSGGASMPSVQPSPVSKPLTAGGIPVPVKSRNQALKAGYYCPSWDATPGQVASTICIPLDK